MLWTGLLYIYIYTYKEFTSICNWLNDWLIIIQSVGVYKSQNSGWVVGYWILISLINVEINLWLICNGYLVGIMSLTRWNETTINTRECYFFLTEQTYKFSRASNNYSPHCNMHVLCSVSPMHQVVQEISHFS